MTADVYAADDALGRSGKRPGLVEGFAIRLVADADPDVLLRVSALLNVLNDAPRRFVLDRRPDATVLMNILVVCSARDVELVCRKLEQLTSVLEVSSTPQSLRTDPKSSHSSGTIP